MANAVGVERLVPAVDVNAYLFASDQTAPRRRRPVDVVQAVVAALVLFLVSWGATNHPAPDGRVVPPLGDLPSWLSALGWAAYTLSGAYAVGLAAMTLVRGGVSRGVARDLALSGGVVLGLALGVARWISGTWPDVVPEVFDVVDPPAFPGLRIALTLTVVGVLGPHLNVSIRRLGRWAAWGAVVGSLLLALTTVSGVVAAVASAALAVALIRIVFGSPEGLPPVGRLGEALGRLGVAVAQVRYAERQTGGVGRATAVGPDGRSLDVKVYGRDAADAQRAERIWRSIWYRSSGPPPQAAPLRQVEHEALGLLIARDFAVSVPELVAAGEDVSGDALLVTAAVSGTRFADLTDVDDDVLDAAWRGLRMLAAQRFAHGGIGPASVVVRDGEVTFTDLDSCSLTASEQRLSADVVSLLATTTRVVGAERAIASAIRVIGTEGLESCLPYLQAATLPSATRRALAEVDLDELRSAVTAAIGVEELQLAQLRRVTLAGVSMVIFGAIAANAIVSQIADIGFDVLADQLAAASIGWLVVALLVKLAGYVSGYLSLRGIVEVPLPIGPTVLMKSATSFIGLVLPSTLGATALNIRYLQKLGTPTSVAVAQGPLLSLVGFVVEITLLLSTASSIGQDASLGDLTGRVSGTLLGLAVLLALAGIVVVLSVPRLRNLVVPPVVEAVRAVRGVFTSPSRLASVVGGEVLERVVSALTLAMVVAAFGAHLAFASLVFVTVGSTLLAGIAPVPGGVGVAEAIITGLLTAAGLPGEQAFAIAITYRIVTSYLPPVLGFFALRWLTNQKYL